ncbi:MAG TPA: non-ribosomal peptide synthetase, partial [Thermoanaerobaculia bacterium]
EWNDTAGAPPESDLAALFARQVARAPEAPAVEMGGLVLTYAELDRRAKRLAHRLRGLGLPREGLVGLYLAGPSAMVVAMVGALQAGGAYLPLDPSYPEERLVRMLAGTFAIVSEGPVPSALAALGPRTIDLLHEAMEEGGSPAIDPPVPALPGSLAYVMYTSGSTGEPKGIAVTQEAVCRLVKGTDYVALGAGDRVAQVATFAFDVATFEVWGALLNGGCVVGFDRQAVLVPQQLAAELARTRIDAMFLTTSLFHQVAAEVPNAFSGVRDLLVGGEAIEPASFARVLAAGGPRRLLNAYGPTEGTTFSCWQRVDAVAAGATSVPIGRPIANTSAIVVGRDFLPVPLGVVGELCLGGLGLARGYLGRPELTAEAFVPAPHGALGTQAGERLYRTGDLCRQLPDGRIDYLGRRDAQVKVRGFRIELPEIEQALAGHPSVLQAVVAVRAGEGDDRRLAAYLVAAQPERFDAAALRDHLRRTLPDYMVPSLYMLLPALPLNANGKVDRAALPDPEGQRAAPGAAYAPPEGDLEAAIAQVAREVLRVDRVGRDDSFFDLGGHSLLMVRLSGELAERLARPVAVVDLFRCPTVASLARQLAGGEEALSLAPSAERAEALRQGRGRRRGVRQERLGGGV